MFKANIEETSLYFFSVFITTVSNATGSMLGSRNSPREGRGLDGRVCPTKNIIEDLTRSVQISQEIVRSSYQIYLIRTQVKNLTCSYQISLV